jgi:hypothetical protein
MATHRGPDADTITSIFSPLTFTDSNGFLDSSPENEAFATITRVRITQYLTVFMRLRNETGFPFPRR